MWRIYYFQVLYRPGSWETLVGFPWLSNQFNAGSCKQRQRCWQVPSLWQGKQYEFNYVFCLLFKVLKFMKNILYNCFWFQVYQWKLLNHVARDHNLTLKPAHLSYKCTVCTATFGMYKQFENHVYSAHSVVAKRVIDKNKSSSPSKPESTTKPLKINDEITIIPQHAKSATSTNI